MDRPRPAFDREEMLDRLDGDEKLLGEVLQVFLDEHARLLGDLRRAVSRRSAADVRRAAHSLRGALLNISAAPAAGIAAALERMGDRGELEASADALGSLESELERLEGELRAQRSAAR